MDEIVKKVAALGLPGVLLAILTATGGATASLIGTLTALGGPFGFGGGLFLFGLTVVLGDAISGYGIEAILKGIYTERSKTESVRFLLKEINDLPITDELKLKLKNHLSPEATTSAEPVEEPRTVEIVEE